MKNIALAIFVFAATLSSAQTHAGLPNTQATMVSRTTKAVHYRLQGGQTKVDFQGTDLLQGATGEARVEGKKTNFEIEVKFQNLEEATKFGLEYLTYVALGRLAARPPSKPRRSISRSQLTRT